MTAAPPPEIGRFTSIHSPHIQADTMLLDTVTGRTWQLQTVGLLNGDPVAWQEIYRMDQPTALSNIDLTGSFCTKRIDRNWFGEEFCHAEEETSLYVAFPNRTR